jgi:hypothetical protein
MSDTPLLDHIHSPEDLRKFTDKDLRQIADELRRETVEAVSVTGGHLGAGLGVIELTVALHYLFDTRSSPAAATASARCARAAGFPASPSATRANTTCSARAIRPRRSPPGPAWPWPAT